MIILEKFGMAKRHGDFHDFSVHKILNTIHKCQTCDFAVSNLWKLIKLDQHLKFYETNTKHLGIKHGTLAKLTVSMGSWTDGVSSIASACSGFGCHPLSSCAWNLAERKKLPLKSQLWNITSFFQGDVGDVFVMAWNIFQFQTWATHLVHLRHKKNSGHICQVSGGLPSFFCIFGLVLYHLCIPTSMTEISWHFPLFNLPQPFCSP